jgi:hypothetical protein
LRIERRGEAGRGMSANRWISTFNATNWRISTFNGALLAAYFIPTWTIVACRIIVWPVHGFYERPNISVALFVSDHLHLAAMSTVRFAWLLALGKLTVVAFFALFVVFITRAAIRKPADATKRSESRSPSAASSASSA